MSYKTYYSKPTEQMANSILSEYGMFQQDGVASFNDIRTTIFLEGAKRPVVLDNVTTLTREAIGLAIKDQFSKITDVRYSSEVIAVADGAFRGCTSLSSFSGPESNSLLVVGPEAFKGCTSLKSIELDIFNMYEVSPTAFEGCPIESITCKVEHQDLTFEDEEWGEFIKSRIRGEDVQAPSRENNRIVPIDILNIQVDTSAGYVQEKSFDLDDVRKDPALRSYVANDPMLSAILDNDNIIGMRRFNNQRYDQPLLLGNPYGGGDLPPAVTAGVVIVAEILGGLVLAASAPGVLAAVGVGALVAGAGHAAIISLPFLRASPSSNQKLPYYAVHKLAGSNSKDKCGIFIPGKFGFKGTSGFGKTPTLNAGSIGLSI